MASKVYYQAEMRHNGLNKYRIVKASTKYELEQKCRQIENQWNEQWAKKLEHDRREKEMAAKKAARESVIQQEEEAIRHAIQQSYQADCVQKELDSILLNNLSPYFVVFDKMKRHDSFTEQCPIDKPLFPIPLEPQITDVKYNPKPSFFVQHSKKRLAAFNDENKKVFEQDHKSWENESKDLALKNSIIQKENNRTIQLWQNRRDDFYKNQREFNQSLDNYKEQCVKGVPEVVGHYFENLLNGISFPIQFSRKVSAVYQQNNNSLIVDYQFPKKDDVPNTKEVTYIKSKKDFKKVLFSDSYIREKYDDVVYQMILVLLNTIFADSDQHPIIQMAVINGRVDTVDKRTGNPINPVILSVSSTRESFMQLNLEAISPKEWFRSAKGISAASLASVAPVAPLININKNDKRFIEGYSVTETIDSKMNLAAIDWQDFENLIRELFEKEFKGNGGEVRITQASRDGGVDAVAFDPDPIRGGKIVIQAKRYTNVVGVSAVRDLYGTLLHEGATKGILVTTANYGNDAYDFAKGKPITLLNGANLLSLLEKHGYKARIDLKEAKEILKQN